MLNSSIQMLQLCCDQPFFSLTKVLLFLQPKKLGKSFGEMHFPRVNSTKFANFLGDFCQHFDIKKIWVKKKKNLVMM
jgi:hypothetical protein